MRLRAPGDPLPETIREPLTTLIGLTVALMVAWALVKL